MSYPVVVVTECSRYDEEAQMVRLTLVSMTPCGRRGQLQPPHLGFGCGKLLQKTPQVEHIWAADSHCPPLRLPDTLSVWQ